MHIIAGVFNFEADSHTLSTRGLFASHYELTSLNVASICLAGVLIHFETPGSGFQTEKQRQTMHV